MIAEDRYGSSLRARDVNANRVRQHVSAQYLSIQSYAVLHPFDVFDGN